MRLIEINHWKELNEKLQNLKGKEYLYVKINGVSRTGWTKAIDLKNFNSKQLQSIYIHVRVPVCSLPTPAENTFYFLHTVILLTWRTKHPLGKLLL